MRAFLPTFLVGIAMSGTASASSFAELEPAGTRISPSIIFLGAPAPSTLPDAATVAQQVPFAPLPAMAGAQRPDGGSSVTQVSPSIIALGPLQPEVDLSRFAAIGGQHDTAARGQHLAAPMVIRGGLYGDAFTRGRGTPPASAPAQKTAQNPAKAGGASTSQKAPDKREPEKAPDTPPAVRPPPTAKME